MLYDKVLSYRIRTQKFECNAKNYDKFFPFIQELLNSANTDKESFEIDVSNSTKQIMPFIKMVVNVNLTILKISIKLWVMG